MIVTSSSSFVNVNDRKVYRSFWDNFSGRADNTSMLLNANADEFEALDRAEIIGMIPAFDSAFVVDIGAGIGRFTTEFAKRARRVVSTDFMANFIEKNRERNAAFSNIEWRVSDALGLEFDEGSVDMVFSNWLLMYLGDEEAVQFLSNALRWLRPGGHLHLRESCSEPSSKNTVKGGSSLHGKTDEGTNPTRYRFSSAYIRLLSALRFRDRNGICWRFDVHWACSISVYVEKNANWRQVHWLASKVSFETDAHEKNEKCLQSPECLVKMFTKTWPEEQRVWDEKLGITMNKNIELSEKMAEHLVALGIGTEAVLLIFNLQHGSADELSVDAQTIAKRLGCSIWSSETNPFCYRHALTAANQNRDRRVRHSWHSGLSSAIKFWEEKKKRNEGGNNSAAFSALIGVDLFSQINGSKGAASRIAKLLPADGILLNVELIKNETEIGKMMEVPISVEFSFETSTPLELGCSRVRLLTGTRRQGKMKDKHTDWTNPINGGF